MRNVYNAGFYGWKNIDEITHWFDSVEKEINTLNLSGIVKLDTSFGDIVLPAGYEWNVPSLGKQPGPVVMDKVEMFAGYNAQGQKVGGRGGFNIIIFGNRLSDGQKVIARMQGYEFLPKDVKKQRQIRRTATQLKSKIRERIKDFYWHTQVQQLGLTGKLHEAIILPWKTTPKLALNAPSVLQISDAQDQDLWEYFTSKKVTEQQKLDAFKMYLENYLRLLREGGIALLDIKPLNATVTINTTGDATSVMLIDIDDMFTYRIDKKDDKQVTVYWLAAVIQTLAMVERARGAFSTTSNGSITPLRQLLTDFMNAHPFLSLTWDEVRNIAHLGKTNVIARSFRKLLNTPLADPDETRTRENALVYAFNNYVLNHVWRSADKLDDAMQKIQNIAAQFRFSDYHKIMDVIANPSSVNTHGGEVSMDMTRESDRARKGTVMRGLASRIESFTK